MNGLASVCGSNSVLPVPSKSPSYLLLVYNSVVRSFTHSKGGKVNTPLLFLGPLWREGKELSTKSTTIALQTVCKKLDLELHGTQEDQRGPIESELNEYGQAAVFLPKLSADTGVHYLTSASSWTSSLGKWLANTRPCSDRSLHANGVTQLLGDGRLFFWIA